jgi:hypothetical protein
LLEGCTPKTPLKKGKLMEDRKSKYDKKFVRKTIRFTEDEFAKIENQISEHNLTFTEFARSAILRKKIKTNLSKEMIFEVNRIGNNLNQIAKKVNSDSDRKNLLIQLIAIQNQLKEISNVY